MQFKMNTIDKYNTGVTFKGFNLAKTEAARIMQRRYSFYAGVLNQTTGDIINLTKNAPNQKMNFFNLLVKKYNQNNFYVKFQNKENPDFVKQIFKAVEKPEVEHSNFASTYNGSFESLLRIFKASNNKLDRINFAQKVYDKIALYQNEANRNIIAELLESPNSEEYIENYDKYKSYIQLNFNNENAIKDLDKMLETNTFNGKAYDTELNYKECKKSFPFEETEVFNAKVLAENGTKAKSNLLSRLSTVCNIDNGIISGGIDKKLLDIYMSTTDDNLEIRKHIIQTVINNMKSNDTKTIADTLAELNTLFKKIDADKHAKNFLFSVNSNYLREYKLSDINEIFNNVSALKLDIFKDNANSILGQCDSGSVIETLKKEIENPFFKTNYRKKHRKDVIQYKDAKSKSLVSKLYKKVKNQINIIKYKLAKNKMPNVDIQSDGLSVKNMSAAKITSTKINQKEEIIKNIYEIAGKKLGLKTFEKQKESYGKNATKMRLKLLPEIFASIKETRATDKAAGKKRSYSFNKDAIELFQLINGKNRKFVNYLLKKRNADKTRMFEVKDIIRIVKQANNKIQNEKTLNPEYKSKDEKNYYNKLYDAKIQQYGKA